MRNKCIKIKQHVESDSKSFMCEGIWRTNKQTTTILAHIPAHNTFFIEQIWSCVYPLL